MAESIRIDAGIKRVLINDGPDYIEFNPSDVVFVEKFYRVIGEFEKRLTDFESRGKELDKEGNFDEAGVPDNMEAKISFMREVCKFAFEQIDFLFGEGISQKLFGGMESLDMIQQFFTQLTPFVQKARQERVDRYRPRK